MLNIINNEFDIHLNIEDLNSMKLKLKSDIWLWLVIPILGVFAQIGIETFVAKEHLAALHSEFGPHEALQFFIILTATLLALFLLFKSQIRGTPFLFAWVGIAFICGVYVSGEELSWGQHIFEWGTPEYWENLNDQGETNFHNTSSWLDQKPRLLLEIGVLIGGIIIPTLQYFKVKLPEKFDLIYPDPKVFVTSIIALFINIVDKIDDATKDVDLMARPSEVEEVYLFYFVLLYLIYFRKRLTQGV